MEDLQAVQHILDLTGDTATDYGISEHDVSGYTARHAGMHWMQRAGAHTLVVEATLLMAARLHRKECHVVKCKICDHLRIGLIAALASLRETQNAELERRLSLHPGLGGDAI